MTTLERLRDDRATLTILRGEISPVDGFMRERWDALDRAIAALDLRIANKIRRQALHERIEARKDES